MNTENSESKTKLEENHECIFEPFRKEIEKCNSLNADKDQEKAPKINVMVFGAEIKQETSEGYESHNTLMISGNLKILKDTIEKSKNETINEKTSKENNPEVTVNNQIAKIENGKKTNAEKENTKLSLKYYIIAGSFKIEENANNRVSELKLKGYKNAGILENKQKNLFMVYYDCFNSQDEVVKAHQNITKIENPESWILKK